MKGSTSMDSPTPLQGHAPPITAPDVVTAPLLDVHGLTVELGSGAMRVRILNEVSLRVHPGQTVGLVGESGSGKSTFANTLVGDIKPSAGSVRFNGMDTTGLRGAQLCELRRKVQLIPQDPYSSLNPRRTIGQTLAEAIDPRRGTPRRHAAAITGWLERVSLPPESAQRYPHEFSGGQRQRIAPARGVAGEPDPVFAERITSALDLTTQADILNLLGELRSDLGLTMLFISHNLSVVRHVSDEVAVLYHGDLVEFGGIEQVYSAPEHPYTRRLLESVPGGPGFNIDGDTGQSPTGGHG